MDLSLEEFVAAGEFLVRRIATELIRPEAYLL